MATILVQGQTVYAGPFPIDNLPGDLGDFLNLPGLCSGTLWGDPNAIKPFRYGTMGWRPTLTVGPPGNYNLIAGATATAFAKGIGEEQEVWNQTGGSKSTTIITMVLDRAETDAKRGGAFVPPPAFYGPPTETPPDTQVFVMTGLEVSALEPSETAVHPTPGNSPAMLDSEVGLLDERLRMGILTQCFLTIEVADNACFNQELGIPLHWVGAMGAHGGHSNSSNRVPAQVFLRFYAAFPGPTRNAPFGVSFRGTFPHGMTVGFSASVTVPAEIDLFLSLRVWGFPVFVSDLPCRLLVAQTAPSASITKPVDVQAMANAALEKALGSRGRRA